MKSILAAAIATLFAGHALAGSTVNGPMAFDPIPGSAYGMENSSDIFDTPWVIPEGFTQYTVSDETDLNIYVANDWNDMNAVNETGKHAGRYLYRTHEVRAGAIGTDGNSARIDGGSGGAVSVVDLKTGLAKEVVGREDWEALDTAASVNLGGWFLTDDRTEPTKYRIPTNTTILAGGYLQFTENQFGPAGANAFALSSLGEEVYLFSGDGTNITGYRHGFEFGAQTNGVAFARHVSSDGEEHFVTPEVNTLSFANSGPKVGPIAISEIM